METLCYPAEIDVRVLNDFCRSCPSQPWIVDWGHNYGGIYQTWPTLEDPTLEDPPLKVEANLGGSIRRSSCCEVSHADPLRIPELEHLLRETKNIKQSRGDPASVFYRAISHRRHFEELPKELLWKILLYLPSKDVLNLRLTSGVFATMVFPQSFWASRFSPEFDHASVFEIRDDLRAVNNQRDWKALFFGLMKLSNGPGLKNRK